MIRTKSLFVLGAGASADYQFPLFNELHSVLTNWGDGLTENKRVNRDTIARWQACHAAARVSFPSIYDEFIRKYRASTARTIDEFLSHDSNETFRDIALYMITLVIRSCESTQALLSRSNSWYSELAEYMGRDLSETLESRCAFVTFNYDRSLEQFFYSRFRNFFSLSHNDAFAAVASLKIWHVHGRIGTPGSPSDPFDYSEKRTEEYFGDVGNIFTIGTKQFEPRPEIKDYMWTARRNYFLGFGFHAPNVEKLEIDWRNPEKKFTSTSLGLSDDQKSRIMATCKGVEIVFPEDAKDCYSLLRNYPTKFD